MVGIISPGRTPAFPFVPLSNLFTLRVPSYWQGPDQAPALYLFARGEVHRPPIRAKAVFGKMGASR